MYTDTWTEKGNVIYPHGGILFTHKILSFTTWMEEDIMLSAVSQIQEEKITLHMQSKTTMRYHLTLFRMAIINKSTNNKCWRGYGEKGTLLNYW